MNELPNWQIYGVPALIVIVSIINYLRESYDMPKKYAMPVATVIGIVFGAMLYLSDINEVALVVTQIVLGGIVLGLAASGYYSHTKYMVEAQE